MNFKCIEATFKQSFVLRGGKQITQNIKVVRCPSGANDYGDRSQHIMYVNDVLYTVFDTRYSNISTNKNEWLLKWAEIMRQMWAHNKQYTLATISYNESISD